MKSNHTIIMYSLTEFKIEWNLRIIESRRVTGSLDTRRISKRKHVLSWGDHAVIGRHMCSKTCSPPEFLNTYVLYQDSIWQYHDNYIDVNKIYWNNKMLCRNVVPCVASVTYSNVSNDNRKKANRFLKICLCLLFSLLSFWSKLKRQARISMIFMHMREIIIHAKLLRIK